MRRQEVMARDWKQRLLTPSSLTRGHSGLQTLPQMAKSELIVGRQPVPGGGQEMPDNTTARLTRRGAARNPVRTRMPLGPQPCSTVRGSGEQCWLCACVNVCVRVCARVQAAARGLDPGSPAVPVPPLPPDPLTATSRSGKRCPGPSSVRQGWGGCFRGGPARPYPRLASPSR